MMRKPMEDVVSHTPDRPRPIASGHTSPQNESPEWGANQARQGNNRIENNPFFKKERRPSEPQFPPRVKQKSQSRTFLWSTMLFALFVVSFFVINHFASATVEIAPLAFSGHIDADFTAAKVASDASMATSTLLFHFVSLVDEKSESVTPVTNQNISDKASGQVIIYNAYSKNSQQLVKNTRLESADHKIFRIPQAVVVPGATIVGGKVTQPGSVGVTVYADAPGADYNIGLTDFTIPGFKGDPRYTKFTAKSKPDSPIAGGFIGTVKVPADAEVKKAQDDIKLSMKTTAVEKARALIPAAMSFFPGSTVIKFEDVPEDYSSGSVTSITVRATVSIFFFDTAPLTQKFSEGALSDYKGNPVSVSNMSALTFAFTDSLDNAVLSDLTQIHFHVTGDPTFVGTIDTAGIQKLLAGKDKKDFGKLITGQSNIGRADVTVRPMWKTVFPSDPSKISIKILTPNNQ